MKRSPAKPTPDDLRLAQELLTHCRLWNGGLGLIVPPSMAKELEALGLEGFTASRPLPEAKP